MALFSVGVNILELKEHLRAEKVSLIVMERPATIGVRSITSSKMTS
jgi:hypothetical protein